MSAPYAQAAARVSSAQRALAEAYAELARISETLDAAEDRGQVNALLWACAAGQPSRDRFFSQYGQDAYLDAHVFGRRRGGVFVEVGGFDGVTGSNGLFFEIFRGWSGLLIEPVPEHLEVARQFRRCPCIGALVGSGEESAFLTIESGPIQMSGLDASYDPKRRAWVEAQPALSMRRETRPTERLGDILRARGLTRIDLVSLDIEGAETAVLDSFPFDEVAVGCWCIETADRHDSITAFMAAKGFQWIDRIGHDDIYVTPDLA